MSVPSTQDEGWQDAAAFLVMTVVAVYFWYTHDLYVNWVVVGAGIVSGAVVYNTYDIPDDHPVAGFPITTVVVVAMLAALMIEPLVAGVVAMLAVATTMEVREQYAKNRMP